MVQNMDSPNADNDLYGNNTNDASLVPNKLKYKNRTNLVITMGHANTVISI